MKKEYQNAIIGQAFSYKNTKEDGFVGVAPVMQYEPNGYGLYDMAGNVGKFVKTGMMKTIIPLLIYLKLKIILRDLKHGIIQWNQWTQNVLFEEVHFYAMTVIAQVIEFQRECLIHRRLV